MLHRWSHVLAACHLLSWAAGRVQTTPPHRDVATTQGTVRGYLAPRPPHYAYLGVPYARPPTARRRFKAPEPARPWSGIFEAVHRVRCPQPDGAGDENCLVVNVFAPERGAYQPVIVHIHDGGFQRGWGYYEGPTRLLEQSFVFVTFNYRLGFLGFLCLGLEEIPGNAGLKDQVAALYWVNRNIEKFGGDPSDVTVYGTGSGAVSIELLLYSELTKNLFHKAILESGSALSPSAISYEPVHSAFNFARSLGYTEDSILVPLSEFYYEISSHTIANTSINFLPCIESKNTLHSLIDKDPREYLQSSKYQHVPMMIIYTNAKEISVITENIHRFSVMPENFENLLPDNLVFDDELTKSKVAGYVKDFYFDDIELIDKVIQSYVAYINDIFMEYPIVKSAVYHTNNETVVYLMKCLYKGSKDSNTHRNIPGASFGDPLQYIFAKDQLEDYDEIIAERLITMWTNFIKLGDPTPLTTLLVPEIWQPVVPHLVDHKIVLCNIPYLIFGKTIKNKIITSQRFIFWDRIYDKFYINLLD